MDREQFIKLLAMAAITVPLTGSALNALKNMKEQDVAMPVLFIGHGNPMNAIEDNEYSRAWKAIAKQLPVPKAILCISAHWYTKGTFVTAMPHPTTIHDFGGFPQELFKQEYPAPGAPELAKATAEGIKHTNVILEKEHWGLDHGTWSVLLPMYPHANIPVYQLSIDYTKSPEFHYNLAKELQWLRKKGVLIIGSGNVVHNLGMAQWKDTGFDWAQEFDHIVKTCIDGGDHKSLIQYEKYGKLSEQAIPTNEHYLPMLYSLALQQNGEEVKYFVEKTTMGSISMRSFTIG